MQADGARPKRDGAPRAARSAPMLKVILKSSDGG
jgi:hypothetical protein